MSTDLAARRAPVQQRTELAIFPADTPGGEPMKSLVKTGPNGVVRSMLTHVQLREDKGEVYRTWNKHYQGREDRMAPCITAVGYDHINQFTSISFIHPDTVMGDDGQPKPNPYMHRDPETGDLRWVRIHIVGIGMDPIGNMVAHDVTLNYDLGLYFSQDLLTKWKGYKRKGQSAPTPKEWGKLLPAARPKGPGGAIWAPYRVPGDLLLWVRLDHPDVLEMIAEHNNRIRFAERNAQTIARRNVLKRFLAAVNLDETLTVPVVAWARVDRDMKELAEMVSQAKAGRISAGDVVLEVEHATDDVGYEEATEALHGDAEEDGRREDAPDDDAPGVEAVTRPPFDPRLMNLRTKIREHADKLTDDVVYRILGDVGLSGMDEVGHTGDVGLLTAANEALGRAVMESLQKSQPATANGNRQETLLPADDLRKPGY